MSLLNSNGPLVDMFGIVSKHESTIGTMLYSHLGRNIVISIQTGADLCSLEDSG